MARAAFDVPAAHRTGAAPVPARLSLMCECEDGSEPLAGVFQPPKEMM